MSFAGADKPSRRVNIRGRLGNILHKRGDVFSLVGGKERKQHGEDGSEVGPYGLVVPPKCTPNYIKTILGCNYDFIDGRDKQLHSSAAIKNSITLLGKSVIGSNIHIEV